MAAASAPERNADPVADIEDPLTRLLRAELDQKFAGLPAMLHAVDDNGRILAVSDAWLARLGWTREETIGRPIADFLKEGAPAQIAKKDGGILDALVMQTRHRGCALFALADVSELTGALRRLQDSEARYRSVVEDQSELVSLATPEGVLVYVNEAYARLRGGCVQDIVGRNLFDFAPPDERPALVAHFARVCATRDRIESENEVVLPDGARRRFAWTNRALPGPDGAVAMIHSVGRDIQARVDAERRLQESEARYRFLAEYSSDLILLVDKGGRRLYASPASRTLLGYEPAEFTTRQLADDLHPDDAAQVLAVLRDRPGDTRMAYRVKRKDGAYVWVETAGRTVDVAGGGRQRLVIMRDIDSRVAAEERVKASEARYRLLADYSTDVVIACDRNLIRTYVSPASYENFGYRPEELLGKPTAQAAHPEDAAELIAGLQALREGRLDRFISRDRRRHKDGRWVWAETHYRAVRSGAGAFEGVVGTSRDVSARKAMEDELASANERLRALADQDALTGLANRRAFDAALAREHARARAEHGRLSLVIFDVDCFKAYNDFYGHPAGDDCLRRIAVAIADAAPGPGGLAARNGGEEFALLLPALDEAGALALAQRTQQAVFALALPHCGSSHGVVTLCAGVAELGWAEPAEALIREADRALYLAKNGGRNRVMPASACAPALR